MTEDQILTWMRSKIAEGSFRDAASLARAFLEEHSIENSLDPNFSKTMDAGFKLAEELADKPVSS